MKPIPATIAWMMLLANGSLFCRGKQLKDFYFNIFRRCCVHLLQSQGFLFQTTYEDEKPNSFILNGQNILCSRRYSAAVVCFHQQRFAYYLAVKNTTKGATSLISICCNRRVSFRRPHEDKMKPKSGRMV